MSCDKSKENYRPNKVRALEEVVSLLKKHVRQRESEIEGLGKQLKESSDRIVDLEKRLGEKESNQDKESSSTDKETLIDRLKELELEREHLEKKIVRSKREKNDAQKATNRAANDLEAERSRDSREAELMKRSGADISKNPKTDEKVSKELEVKKIESPEDTASEKRQITKVKSRTMSSRDQQMLDLSMDNEIMREKLDRMHEISAENLLLQSDVADYHAELSELRAEAKELRAKCYELIEDNRIYKAEVRDLRRYIDLQKANKSGDTRQDLLNKIEYYQMEHDRLLDEVRRLKNRLGDLSPRRSRDSSPRSLARRSPRDTKAGVRFNDSAERSKSPISDAIAASTASSHAAVRLSRDRKTLSPSAALNLRDLTMERYKTHLTRAESHSSINSDNTEVLLKSRLPPAVSAPSAADEFDRTSSDEEEPENCDLKADQKLPERYRSSSRCRSPASSYRSGFRSLSPRMTSTQNDVKDTARDRYATLLKRSLPRRAFAPRSPADLRLGYAIKFTRPGGKLSRGTVRYIGHLASRNEIFIGVELDSTDGKHTGTFQGVKYFSCPINKGIFTPFSKVIMAWE